MNESITDSLCQLGLSDGQVRRSSGTKQVAHRNIFLKSGKMAMH
jgi:hypothetical protein